MKSILVNLEKKTFGERFKEHLEALSSIYDYYNITGHLTTV